MRSVTPELLNYFASLYSRLSEAEDVPFREVSIADWQPNLPNAITMSTAGTLAMKAGQEFEGG